MPLLAKSARLIVWLVPPVMPTVKEFVELSKAKAAMFCASVLRLDKFTVWVFPSLIAMVRVLVSRLAVSVWLSVFEPPAKEEKSKVTMFPSLMAKVMVLLPLKAEAVKV